MKNVIIISSVVFLMSACASPRTDITGTWKSPDLTSANYDRIMVVAMVDDASVRNTLESNIADELRDEGVVITKSTEVFGSDAINPEEDDKEEVLQKIRDAGADGIMIVSLIDTQTETRYVPGSYAYDPVSTYPYYDGFWGYYSYWYPRVYTTGYYDMDKSYFMETNLYDANTEKLIWSAQTETTSPTDLEMLSEGLAEEVVEEMEDAELI